MKKISALVLIIAIISFALCTNIYANNIKNTTNELSGSAFKDYISGEITTVTIKDSTQPNVTWDLAENDIEKIISIINNFELLQDTAERTEKKFIVYFSTYFPVNATTSASIYNNGLLVIAEDTAYSKEYVINNFELLKDEFDVILSTQSEGYRRTIPSSESNVEISDWAVPFYQTAKDGNLLPEYMQVGYITDNITREQFCDLSSVFLRKLTNKENGKNQDMTFQDTNNENVKLLYQANIIKGKDEFHFAPNDFITREEAATILYRMAEYIEMNIPAIHNVVYYWDENKVSDWALDAVKIMREMKVMEGVSGYEFYPNGTYTVEQAITTIVRLYDKSELE